MTFCARHAQTIKGAGVRSTYLAATSKPLPLLKPWLLACTRALSDDISSDNGPHVFAVVACADRTACLNVAIAIFAGPGTASGHARKAQNRAGLSVATCT